MSPLATLGLLSVIGAAGCYRTAIYYAQPASPYANGVHVSVRIRGPEGTAAPMAAPVAAPAFDSTEISEAAPQWLGPPRVAEPEPISRDVDPLPPPAPRLHHTVSLGFTLDLPPRLPPRTIVTCGCGCGGTPCGLPR